MALDLADATADERYEMVVGLEVHVQLATRTKAFCNCATDFGDPPNQNTCPVCLGLPGTLPVLNARAVELGVRAALALRCTVQEVSVFARKNYFYPDLPKGYQITQYDRPLATGGMVAIGQNDAGGDIQVGLVRAHLEEDAGKSVHDRFAGATAVDLNRAGTPLIEIVTCPDMRSAAEAGALLRVLRQVLEYVGVSDVNMEEGSLRVDANISARLRGETSLGTKTELKNLNSFSAVERALQAEFRRQCAILDAGGRVEQQTILWDEQSGAVRPSRAKEGGHDYRYFPEPDLPPLVLTREWIELQRRELPELPRERRERFVAEYGLSDYDADVLTALRDVADYYEGVARQHGEPKAAANWVMGELLAALKRADVAIGRFPVRPADLAQLLNMVRDELLSQSAAKRVFATMVETGDRPERIAERDGLLKVTDAAALGTWLDEAVAEHGDAWERLQAGERKLIGVIVGDVMKRSRGSADPRRVNQLLLERLDGG